MSDEDRFAFGQNWKAFLAALDEQRIVEAMASLQSMLRIESLAGRRFLDLGSGSGLFSLAAHRLGAEVVSVDFDAQCVACTEELRRRYGSAAPDWQIVQGSVLDEPWMQSLGVADVVYSWGVLHHTGNLDRAMELAADRTRGGGVLMIAVYNDQGGASRRWLTIKKAYHRLPAFLRPLWVIFVAGIYEIKFAFGRVANGRSPLPWDDWRAKKRDRGMSAWHDWVDWIGGLPFEVAAPERVILPLRRRGFVLENLKTVGGGWGCNEYVFSRSVENLRESMGHS